MIDTLFNRSRTEIHNLPKNFRRLGQKLKDYPRESFATSLEAAVVDNRISEVRAKAIREQIEDPKAILQLADIFICSVGIRTILKPVDLAILGASVYNEDPLIALGVVATHGVARFAYMGSRIFYDRVLNRNPNLPGIKKDLAALAAAAFPIIGNLAAPWRAKSFYPELASFAIHDTGHKLNNLLIGSEPNSYNLPTVYRPGL